ncbi:NDP-hexose 2,3-dehydratase family protein [Candidatus Uhrbacteria bacterium]|nr:NDP-hexose 2,3-dehydratase family protein [Candidatus Uhrbacteria bacterium]
MNIDADTAKNAIDRLYDELRQILHFSGESKNVDFYLSALIKYNPFNGTEEIEGWLRSLNSQQYFSVQQIPLRELRQWSFHPTTGNLEHASGGFFSIRGLKVRTNIGSVTEWSQPIIYQPDIGILGIITKKFHGILYFLIQAKAEPGNLNNYQLSPTVQATRSNYTRLHGGKSTLYLEHFLGDQPAHVLIDQLQSEQGARFFCKRNRNMIVRLRDDENIELGPYHRWVTLGQLHTLLQKNNVVNMDTRSVISEINFAPERVSSLEPVRASALRAALEASPLVQKPIFDLAVSLMISLHPNTTPLHTTEELLQKITREKCKIILERQLIPLNEVTHWPQTANEIFHEKKKYFSIIGVQIQAHDREVTSWDQPIVKQHHAGIIGFIAKEINGVIHFLVQLKMESGVMDLLEMAPTVQCITDNYTPDDMPLYTQKFLNHEGCAIIADSYQSEEGGRFFQESNHNIVLLADQIFSEAEPPFFMWMSLKQLKEFIQFSNFINVEARSLLACLKMI